MTERHWIPVRRLQDLERDIEEAFGALIDQPWGRGGRIDWMPAVDIDETRNAYIITIDLPGIGNHKISVHVRPHEIDISGTRRSARTEATSTRIHTERLVGRFQRTFYLEHPVEPDTAQSACDAGVCVLRVRKRADNGEHEP